MPYISNKMGRRNLLREGCRALNAGELNYQLASYFKATKGLPDYKIMKKFVDNFVGDMPNYQTYNDMTGCLICCYKEIDRRFKRKCVDLLSILASYDKEIAVYEDIKIKENGDI